jgi:FAD/FMN-containing dehydrogenase
MGSNQELKHAPPGVGPHAWVPRKHTIWAYRTFKDLCDGYGLKYAGAMNLPTRIHFDVEVDLKNKKQVQLYRQMLREYAALLREKGGSIMGAHGCGISYKKELRAELNNAFKIMKKVKMALDPKGIMNPRKIF